MMTPAQFAAAYGLSAPTAPQQPAQYLIYRTKSGDRWDTVAYAQYRNATQILALIAANPGVAIVDVFDPGTKLAVPLIGAPDDSLSSSPPWSS